MKFHVYSREQIEGITAWHTPHAVAHAIISLRDPGNPPAKLPITDLTKGVLRQSFWDRDCEDEPHWDPNWLKKGTLYTPEMARDLVSFVRAHEGRIFALLIHCEAGLCRSQAVAAALKRELYGEDDSYHFEHGRPRQLVYRLVREACR